MGGQSTLGRTGLMLRERLRLVSSRRDEKIIIWASLSL
jgi:hypothetical protein